MTFPQRSCSLPVVEHPPIRSSSLATPSLSNTTTTTTTSTTNDTDEAISLLEWKRMSILRTLDWSNILVPTDLWTSSQLFPDINQKDECQETADRLWDGDLSVIEPTSMASFLGRSTPFSQCTLKLYLAHFDFGHLRLDKALRKLCGKLYFKAEAQEIDRILEAFAHRYWLNNMHELYGSSDVVYAVVYSLMLLNTDLHIASGHQRMSRSAFCKNTMNTLCGHIDSVDVDSFGGVDAWKADMDLRLKELYGSVKQQGFTQPMDRPDQSPLNEKPKTLLHKMGSLRLKEKRLQKEDKFTETIPQQHHHRPASGPRLEGKLMCKMMNEKPSRRKTEGWYRECWVSLDRGYLNINERRRGGSFSSPATTPIQRSRSAYDRFRTSDDDTAARGSFQKSSREMHMAYALATPHAPSWYHDGPSPFGFMLQLADERTFIFSCESKAQAQEWIQHCNYWAARESKIPLGRGVSNATFGWESHILKGLIDLDRMPIQDWTPPTIPFIGPTITSQHEQYSFIQDHLQSLRSEHEKHMAVWKPMTLVARDTSRWSQMLRNWENKKRFLDKEIQRYKTYADALQQQEEGEMKDRKTVEDRQSQQQQKEEKTHVEQGPSQPPSTPPPSTPPSSSSWSVKLDFNDTSWTVGTDLLKEINEELKLSDSGSLLST